MGGGVTREETWVHYPGAEPFQIGSRWYPSLGDGGCRFFGDIQERAAIGQFR